MGSMAKRVWGDKKAVPGGARQCVLCPPLASLLLPTASSRVRRICASNCFRVSKCSAMAKRQSQPPTWYPSPRWRSSTPPLRSFRVAALVGRTSGINGCAQLALEAGNGDGATETKELVDRRRGHGCGRALTVRDARCGRLSETGAHPSRCERAGLFWWWPTSVPGCGQQRGELGVGRRCRAREQRKVRGRVNLRAWAAGASRNGASNLVSVSGGLGAGSRSANPRLRGSARVLALLGAGRGRGAFGRQRVPVSRPQTATPRELSTWPKPTGPFRTPARRPQRQRRAPRRPATDPPVCQCFDGCKSSSCQQTRVPQRQLHPGHVHAQHPLCHRCGSRIPGPWTTALRQVRRRFKKCPLRGPRSARRARN